MHSGDDEHVRRAAYELWEKEGRPEGRHDHHWHEARQTSRKTVTPERTQLKAETQDTENTAPETPSSAKGTPAPKSKAKSTGKGKKKG